MNNSEELQHDLFLLVGYLLTSAHGLYNEPPGYGSFRLIDTTGRLLEIMEQYDLSTPFLDDLRQKVKAECAGSSSDEALQAILNDWILNYSAELKQQLEPKEA